MSDAISTHQPCPDCGSSDGLTVYDDHTFCFVCEQTRRGEPSEAAPKRQPGDTLAIPDMLMESLPARGITEETCRKFGYYKANYAGKPVQVACYFGDDRTLLGQKLRFKDKTFSVLGKIPDRFWGQHLWTEGRKLVITEGEIDCLTASQVQANKYPCVSLPKGAGSAKRTFKAQMDWLNGFDEIVLMFDMDEAGKKAVEEVQGMLKPGTVKIASLPYKDANECLLAREPDKIITAIWQAKTYKPDGIVNGSELWEALENEPDVAEGYELPWGPDFELQTMTQGLRPGEITLITAGTGIGKTTFTRQIAHHLGVSLKLRIGMMMLEENVRRTAKGLMSVQAGKRLALNKRLVTPEEYRAIYDTTLGTGNFVFYNHFGSLESENLINKMRYMVTAEGCKFIVLDHISIAISGLEIENERKATDVLMTNLRSLCEETEVGMLIISHLRRVEGQPAEEGGIVSLSHLRGSQALAQLSDTVLALERNQQGDRETKDTVRLRILKCRHTGETGIAGYLRYDRETDRLEVTQQDNNSNGNIDLGDGSDVPF